MLHEGKTGVGGVDKTIDVRGERELYVSFPKNVYLVYLVLASKFARSFEAIYMYRPVL